jgi:hypothetical protein
MTPLDRSRSVFTQAGTAARQPAATAVQNPVGKLVDLARDGLTDIPRFVKMGLDVFEASHLRELNRLFGGSSKPDRLFDGQLVGSRGQTFPPGTPLGQIPGVTPKDNPNPSKTILYVNGIMTPMDGQVQEMQAIADTAGAKVVGIHNSTQGLVTDLAQCVEDKLDKGSNPAVDTLADTLYSELKAGRDVHLMGYSQGGLNVETFGAASTRYPDGPNYVHYVNNADPVPTLTGLGGSVDPLEFLKDAGKGAVVHRFTDGNLNPISNHMLDTLYMKHRVDFDEARAGRF